MKHSSLVLGIAAVLSACGSSKNATTETAEAKVLPSLVPSLTVDGQAQDWQNVPRQTAENGSVEYAVANSPQNLYVLFKIADPAEQMKFVRGGMEVWFDPTGKHAKTTEIIYPVKGELSDETFRTNFIQGEKPNVSDLHRRIESGLVSFNRIGFKPDYSGVQSIRQNTGFKGAVNWDETGTLVYEIAVPFAAFPTDARKETMEIGFFIGAMDKPKTTAEGGAVPQNGGGGTGTGGGMRGGGGRRGGGGGGFRGGGGGRNGQQRTATNGSAVSKKLYEPESFWVQYATR